MSFLCTLGCLIYPWDRYCRKREMAVRIGIHYVYVNTTVLGAGFLFQWYDISHLSSVAVMVVTIALIFIVVSAISWRKAAEDARNMNERLKEYQRQGEPQPEGLSPEALSQEGPQSEPSENEPLENKPLKNKPLKNKPLKKEKEPLEREPCEKEPLEKA